MRSSLFRYLKTSSFHLLRRGSSSEAASDSKVAVSAARGIGEPLALLMKLNPLVSNLAVDDIANTPGVAAGVSHINAESEVKGYTGEDQVDKALEGSDVAGVPRKPGMTCDDIFNINAGIVKGRCGMPAKNYPNATQKANLLDDDIKALAKRTQDRGTEVVEAKPGHCYATLSIVELYSLNTRLASLSRGGNFLATWALFCDMQCVCSEFDVYTFTPVLRACAALPGPERGKQVHALMIKISTDLGTVTKTALIDVYSKHGYLKDSVKAFEEVPDLDVVTWNSLLSSFFRHGLAKKALGIFRSMIRERVEFSEFTLCSVLKACASIKLLRLGKQVHSLVLVMGRDLVVLGTALIDFYFSVTHTDEAMKIFSSLSWRKDDVMYNSFITGCIQNRRYKEAFSILRIMKPNVVALTSALIACSENSDLCIGMQIHCVATRFGFTSETQLCNKLIDMYAKCGKCFHARLVFDGIYHKDIISWTSMIDAYGRHGHGYEALELFNKMGTEGNTISPNSVTFLAVLSACGHSGLVEEGREIFNLVRQKYGLEPGVEHYSCFIDILGRAGKIEDVWSLFHNMEKNGSRPTSAVWVALLNACSLNLDVSRGEFAAKQLLKVEPNNPSNYVLLSNFYASIGRWDFVDSLRCHMRDIAWTKKAGTSWVTVAH